MYCSRLAATSKIQIPNTDPVLMRIHADKKETWRKLEGRLNQQEHQYKKQE